MGRDAAIEWERLFPPCLINTPAIWKTLPFSLIFDPETALLPVFNAMKQSTPSIAVNARLLKSGRLEGIGRFAHEILRRLVRHHPEVVFHLYFDGPIAPEFRYGPNVRCYWLPPPARRPWLWDMWFDISVRVANGILKPQLFFSPDGMVPRGGLTPVIPVIHDLNFAHHPEWLPDWAAAYYNARFPVFAQKAAHILTVSDFSAQDIAKRYHVSLAKISIVHNAASAVFRPITELEKSEIRNEISNGCPYFIMVGAMSPRKNLQKALDAFLLFRQTLQTPFKLVVVGGELFRGGGMPANAEWQEDVLFLGRLPDPELARVLAASSGLIFPSLFEGFGIPILEAFQCGVPVLTGHHTALPEVGGGQAIYADVKNAEQLAVGMAKLLKDSTEMQAARQAQAKNFSWDTSATKVWTVFEKYL
jgi:glycosyltransferase involved in cell wall biosynthesis